jgi:hypothetical protein
MFGGQREEKSRICTQIFPTLNFDDDPENVHRAYECPVKCTTWRGTVRLIFEWTSDESTQFIITVLHSYNTTTRYHNVSAMLFNIQLSSSGQRAYIPPHGIPTTQTIPKYTPIFHNTTQIPDSREMARDDRSR